MYRKEITHYSSSLDREMHIMIYGQEGMPLLCFPTQNSKCHNYEDFGMIDQLSDFINDGRIQLYVVDTVDEESWSLEQGGENSWRSARQEQYFHYIVDEVVPLIHERS